MTQLLVAAGGGGDVIAAAVIHRALDDGHAVIATYAWDRLVVDPVPGPRSAADFDGLSPLGDENHAFTSATAPRPPAGSTLPRLAGDLDETLVLLDPTHGATGLRRQLADLTTALDAAAITIVDVGGDAVARGDEPNLRSPLADSLVLAACRGLSTPATVLVAGPGLDGELTETEVLNILGPDPALRLEVHHINPLTAILDWHPSEATALLAAASLGRRGRVEIRDAGFDVPLTDKSPAVYPISLDDALAVNRLAAALPGTTSLEEAEQIARRVCGFSEIDYERQKAAGPRHGRPETITAAVDATIKRFETEAAQRGIDYVTFRRIAEAADLSPRAAATLRRHLVASRPEQLAWPIWAVSTHALPSLREAG